MKREIEEREIEERETEERETEERKRANDRHSEGGAIIEDQVHAHGRHAPPILVWLVP